MNIPATQFNSAPSFGNNYNWAGTLSGATAGAPSSPFAGLEAELSSIGQALSTAEGGQGSNNTSSTWQGLQNLLQQALGQNIKSLNITQLQGQVSDTQTVAALSQSSVDNTQQYNNDFGQYNTPSTTTTNAETAYAYGEQDTQQLSFTAQGTLVTASGQQLNFKLSFSLTSSETLLEAGAQSLNSTSTSNNAPASTAGNQPASANNTGNPLFQQLLQWLQNSDSSSAFALSNLNATFFNPTTTAASYDASGNTANGSGSNAVAAPVSVYA